MKKKTFIFANLLAIVLSTIFVSCEKDDISFNYQGSKEEEEDMELSKRFIYGKHWVITHVRTAEVLAYNSCPGGYDSYYFDFVPNKNTCECIIPKSSVLSANNRIVFSNVTGYSGTTVKFTNGTADILSIKHGIAEIHVVSEGSECWVKATSNSNSSNNGHEYVDLGLSVNWAACNVGADYPEEYGLYFGWGETVGYNYEHTFSWADYQLCYGSSTTLSKYCLRGDCGTVDGFMILEPEDDAAHVCWGGSWRIPTRDELNELKTKCTWKWTMQDGVKGYQVTSKANGNCIFLPATGNRNLVDSKAYGSYWLNEIDPDNSCKAYFLEFHSDYIYTTTYDRYLGKSVRAVCP